MRCSNLLRRSNLSQNLARHQQTLSPSTRSFATLNSSLRNMSSPLDRSNTIGFIGLGAMGNHMVNNLVTKYKPPNGAAGASFALFDVNEAAVDGVIKRHQQENPNVSLQKCSSPYDVAKRASTIISMVPTGKHVRDVYLGNDSVRNALEELDAQQRSITLCLDQSTIEQGQSQSVALELRKTGADFLDAPVSGGVVGAENGTLAIMVGGDKQSFDRSVPFLQPMGKKVTYCGGSGAGLAAKIANNMLLGITMVGLSEAMLLGKRLGVDPQVLADIINSSTGRCWSSEINHPVPEVQVGETNPPAHRNYEGGFVSKLTHKDLALAVAAAEQADVPLKLGKRVEAVYRTLAESAKWGNRDFSVVYEALSTADIASKL